MVPGVGCHPAFEGPSPLVRAMSSLPPKGSKYAFGSDSLDRFGDVDDGLKYYGSSRKPSDDSHSQTGPDVGQHRSQASATSTHSMIYSDSSPSGSSSEFETADEDEDEENGQRTLASMPFRMRDGRTGTGSTYVGAKSARVLLCVNAAVHIMHYFDTTKEAPGKRLPRIPYKGILPLILALYGDWDIDIEVGIDDILELPMFASSIRTTRVQDVEGSVVDIMRLFRDLGTRALIIASGDRAICVLPSITKQRTVDEAGLTVFTLDDEEGHRSKHAAFLAYASRSQTAQAALRLLNKGKKSTPRLQYCILSQTDDLDPQRMVYTSNIQLLEATMHIRDLESDYKSYQREISIAERNTGSENTKMGHAIEATNKLNLEMQKLQSELDNVQKMTNTILHEQLRGTPNPRPSRENETREEEQRNPSGDKKGKKSGLFGFVWNIGSSRSGGSTPSSFPQEQRDRPSGSSRVQIPSPRGESSTQHRPTGASGRTPTGRPSGSRPDPGLQDAISIQSRYGHQAGRPVEDDPFTNDKGKGRADETRYWDYAPPTVDPGLQEALRLQAQIDQEEALSLELIMAMQEIDRAEAEALAELQRREIPNQPFDCPLCAETCPVSDLTIVEECKHQTCRDCLLKHVKAQISEARWPIWCPQCPPGQQKRGVVSRWLAEIVGADDKVFEHWNRMEIGDLGINVECPRCKISTPVDAEDFGAAETLDCPVGCGAHWCKDCNQQIERGANHSCDGELEFKELMARNPTLFRRCPNGHLIEKNQGCDHMYCTRCRSHFSWSSARQ